MVFSHWCWGECLISIIEKSIYLNLISTVGQLSFVSRLLKQCTEINRYQLLKVEFN